MRKYPALVQLLSTNFDAWIVGSAANPNLSELPRDHDVIVPFSTWQQACSIIPKDAKVNTMGGFKCISEEMTVDVWPGELGFILKQHMCTQAYHPSSGTYVVKKHD